MLLLMLAWANEQKEPVRIGHGGKFAALPRPLVPPASPGVDCAVPPLSFSGRTSRAARPAATGVGPTSLATQRFVQGSVVHPAT